MRIVYINASYNNGSTGRIVRRLGLAAEKIGAECMYVHSSRYYAPDGAETIAVSGRLVELFHILLNRFTDGQGRGSYFATRRILKSIDEFHPDIIHLHNIHGYYINHKLLFEYLSSKRIPVIWTFHDCWPFTGHCAFPEQCAKWESGCSHCMMLNDYPRSFFDGSFRNWNIKKELFCSLENLTIVTVSEYLSQIVSRSFLHRFNVHTICNGVDVDIFKPTPSSIREKYSIKGKFFILGVANTFERRKNLQDYLKLSALLANDCVIILVGAIRGKDAFHFPGNVIHIPHTDSLYEMVELYSSADVLLSLSSAESFGMTPVEAMACGTPAIVYDNSAQPELISKDTGFVVKSGDLKAVLLAIDKIKTKGKTEYSKACIKRVHSLYDIKYNDVKYLDLYKSCV